MMVFHKMLIFIFLHFVFFNYATGFVFAVSVVCLLILALIIIQLKNIKLKNARDAMYNSELKFRMLAENSMDTLWSSDLELNLEYISPSIRTIFGYEREERMSLSLTNLFSQTSARKIKNEILKKTEHFKRNGNIGDHVYLELEGIHKDGTKVWIEVTANLTLDTDGKLKGFQGISRNITPRKNFENGMLELVENLTLNDDILKLKNEELQRVRNEMEQIALKETLNSEKLASTICLMRNVFDAIPGGISVIDKDHNVIELNSKLLEIYGIPDRTEAIGKKCYKVFNCGNEPCATCSFPKLLKSPETIVRQATSDDKFLKGPSYRLYSSPMLDMSGEVVGMVETIVDISDLILAQTALMESEKDFEVFFNEVPDAIFITKLGNNSTGKIINVNPAAELLTGYTKDELIGKNILADISIATPEETIRREQNLSSDGRIEFTEQKRRKDGTLVWTEVVIQKIRFKGSSISLSISRDISVRKIAEEKLRTSELQNRNLLNAIPDLLFVFAAIQQQK